jgi:hypothetical protein
MDPRAFLSLEQAVGNAVLSRHLATLHRKPSDVEQFSDNFSGSLGEIAEALQNHAPLQAIWRELRLAGTPSAVFGLDAIAAAEGETRDTEVRLTVNRMAEPRLEFELHHRDWHVFLNEVRWSDDQKPDPWLFLHKWDKAQGAGGTGLNLFEAMRVAATAAGMKSIIADAIGDPQDSSKPENGYYTWIRFGFNNPTELTVTRFMERLQALHERVTEGLPAWEKEMNDLRGRLPEGWKPDPDTAESRERELRNRERQGDLLVDEEQAELEYLGIWMKAEGARGEDAKHHQALKWVIDHFNVITNLHQLMLRAENKDTRTALAALWRDYGQTVNEAIFDLDPDSDSMKILGMYRADKR